MKLLKSLVSFVVGTIAVSVLEVDAEVFRVVGGAENRDL